MESVDQLTRRRDELVAQSRAAAMGAQDLVADAASKAGEAGAFLVGQRSKWDTAAAAPQLANIDSLTSAIDQVDAGVAEVDGIKRQGLSGFFKRFGDRQRRSSLIKQRDALAAKVGLALQALGESAPEVTVPDAESLLTPARQQLAQARSLQQQSERDQSAASALSGELTRRHESITNMGFDALFTAAWLQSNSPPAVQSPLILKSGEVAWLAVPSTLSRMATQTQYTGSSQGVSFPIGHTGIRYRVGSFRGHPIQSTVLKHLDSGTLVLTNQRLVFVGSTRSVAMSLQHIVHVECYSDALCVFQDKRETPDFLRLQAPQYVLFYINYAIGRLK